MVKFTLEVDRSREFGVPNPTTIIKKFITINSTMITGLLIFPSISL
jgi:hypothetical protein